MKKLHIIAVIAVIFILQSCVSTKIETNKDAGYNQKPKKLYMIITNAKDGKAFGQDLYNGLTLNFKTRNIICDGFVRDPLSLKTEQDIDNDINTFNPDALLLVKMTKITIMNGAPGSAVYELSLIEGKAKKVVWKGNLDVYGPFWNVSTVNSAIKTVINKMQEDQLINTNTQINTISNARAY
ncbi:hypothetical protein SAMN05421821_11065 [Mucilaginibacter lappiensis]|uniref:Lipoprotein n=1 Tax=Mucilaginibacter lappiensis TaxID=354630 RepID=A0ABR6PMP5_9SPHI|nr:hypothetical protein [Mucilaginibacter lappiensis]MBB6111047.1 hypothetical protein [Mucilaginibacter lappiensis]SIR67988.1 hypothetical protein SAMN05421821_11065 [Mucilaginibacter lappiensis]